MDSIYNELALYGSNNECARSFYTYLRSAMVRFPLGQYTFLVQNSWSHFERFN